MDEVSNPSPSDAKAAELLHEPLGKRTTRGIVWVAFQTIALRLVAVVAQLVLGYLLNREDFALIGLSVSFTTFAGLFQQAGLVEILVQRHARFSRWATPAFWMSLAAGCSAGLVLLAVAPFAAHLYEAPHLIGLLCVASVGLPLTSLSTVPTARLQAAMRFRTLTVVNIGAMLANSLLTILLALGGLGAYAYVIPRVIVAPGQAAALWLITRPKVSWRPQVRRWRYLISDSALLLTMNVIGTICMQADNLILGLVCTKRELGAYIFGFGVMSQALALATGAASTALLPALSKLRGEPGRQQNAFARAASAVAVVGMPICALQAALAEPALKILFGSKWLDAIPVVQAGSISLSFGVLNQVIVCMVQAQRRLLAGVRASLVVAALFFFLWTPAALKWKVPGALIAGLVISFATASVFIATAFTSPTERRRFYLRDYLFPLLTSVTTAAIGWFAGRQAIEWWSAGPWLNAVIICVVTGGLYSWLIHLVSPVATQELLARAGEFLKPSVTRLART